MTRLRLLQLLPLAVLPLLASCSNGQFSSPLYLAVTISPRPASVPAGGTVTLSAVVSNNLSSPTWSLLYSSATTSAGTLTTVSGQPNSIQYTAPAAAPIYNNSGVPVGFAQGTVTIKATVAPPAGDTGFSPATDSVSVAITTPTVSVGISPVSVVVGLGLTQYFTAYAVGNVNNALTWQVNGVTGGSSTTGTISTSGNYLAPAVLPITGNTVTITAISQADPTKSASATVTLQ